jgi:hypothetical protein
MLNQDIQTALTRAARLAIESGMPEQEFVVQAVTT